MAEAENKAVEAEVQDQKAVLEQDAPEPVSNEADYERTKGWFAKDDAKEEAVADETEAPEEEPAKVVEAVGLSEAQLRNAARMGLDAETAKILFDKGKFESLVPDFEGVDPDAEEDEEQEQVQATTPAVKKAVPAEHKKDEAATKSDAPIPDLDDKAYDQDLVAFSKAVKADNQALRDELASVRKELVEWTQSLHEQTKQAAVQTHVERIDSSIQKLGEKYPELLGTGSHRLMEKNSEALKNRAAIVREMAVVEAGCLKLGRPLPPEDQMIENAFNALFAKKVTEKATTQAAAQAKKEVQKQLSRGMATARPTQRQGTQGLSREEIQRRNFDAEAAKLGVA